MAKASATSRGAARGYPSHDAVYLFMYSLSSACGSGGGFSAAAFAWGAGSCSCSSSTSGEGAQEEEAYEWAGEEGVRVEPEATLVILLL